MLNTILDKTKKLSFLEQKSKEHFEVITKYPDKYKNYIDNNIKINKDTQCWEWQKFLDKDGYGAIVLHIEGLRTAIKAHRVSFILNKGEIVNGNMICHTCDNPKCVNPNHLFQGTCKDNLRDMQLKGRRVSVRGEQVGSSSLCEKDIAEIFYLHNEGFISKEIGLKLNVKAATIRGILARKTWKHLNYADLKFTDLDILEKIKLHIDLCAEESGKNRIVNMLKQCYTEIEKLRNLINP